jgi:TPR repeat protein
MLLVFVLNGPTVSIMDKPWFRNLFSRPAAPRKETTQTQADGGDAEAQFRLGLKYASGEGDAQDYAQAAVWYLKAADQSHAMAQFNLGVMYARGQGMAKDDAKAEVWIRKAAQQGDAGAQFHLGMRHHRASMGALPNVAIESKLEAYKWLHLAATQGYKGSGSAFECVALTLSREEVADGDRRAKAFVAVSPKPHAGSDPSSMASAGNKWAHSERPALRTATRLCHANNLHQRPFRFQWPDR